MKTNPAELKRFSDMTNSKLQQPRKRTPTRNNDQRSKNIDSPLLKNGIHVYLFCNGT